MRGVMRSPTTRSPGPTKKQAGAILFFFGLYLLYGFGWETVGHALSIEAEGVVTSSQDIPDRKAPRYATKYTVRGSDGVDREVWGGATDGTLPRSMPVGTHIRKQKGHLDLEQDGKLVRFPITFYVIILSIAAALVVVGIRLFVSKPLASSLPVPRQEAQ